MVEGNGCHRVGAAHRKTLLGRCFMAISPNGRFTDGAAAINGRKLTDIQVHGKHLFYVFDELVVHFHFGMSGKFTVHALPGPDTTPTTRLRLENKAENICAHLSAMTVELMDLAGMATVRARLGPDPLREDADPSAFYERAAKTKKPIGLLLMDQSYMAGVGNIYRAEVLFKCGVHPEQPANTVSADRMEAIWRHSVDLLQRGFRLGSIVTVDPEEGLPAPWTRRYIYNQSKCGRCKGPVKSWDMAARTVYCCAKCQPLSGEPSAGRAEKMNAGRTHAEFQSHCAPESGAGFAPGKMSVAQLKTELVKLGLVATGKKAELAARLTTAVAAAGASGPAAAAAAVQDEEDEEEEAVPVEKAVPSGGKGRGKKVATAAAAAPPAAAKRGAPAVRPGTLHIGEMATAAEAIADKVAAGESFAVEHVAIGDDESARFLSPAQRKAQKAGRKGTQAAAAAAAPAAAGAPAPAPAAAAAIAAAVAKMTAAKRKGTVAAAAVDDDGQLAYRKKRKASA